MMDNASDMNLLRQYVERSSDVAFSTLVSRHVNLVYSAALRNAGSTHAAEEITQAVFVILARKAHRISDKTILQGWLYQTTRLTAASFLKSEARRRRREQEAYMQSEMQHAGHEETWDQLAPFLEDAMGQLNEKERSAIVLRFFGDKKFAEVAEAFGISENAAKKQVARALEKLHLYFSRRGISSPTAILADVLSANGVQAAPPGLAQSATVIALGKGASAGSSGLALVKSALKYMAWTKFKTGILASVGIFIVASTATVTLLDVRPFGESSQTQKLADGSVLTLVSAAIEQDDKHILNVSGNLKVKLKLSGARAEDNLLISQDSFRYRPCRALISGKDGFQYENVLYPFSHVGDAYWGQINTCLFPRDSARLHIQIQQRDALDAPWKTIAEFTCRQRIGKDEPWQPERTPLTREVDGMQLTIGEVTLQTGPPTPQTPDQQWEKNWQSEGWNQTVTIPWQLTKDGLIVTNWRFDSIILRDSSGNESGVGWMDRNATNGWMITRTWQPADPRKVWKIEVKLGQDSGFEQGNILTIRIPVHRVAPFETNVAGFPFRIEFFRDKVLSTQLLLTNRTDLRLNFLHSEDQNGRDQSNRSLGRDQFEFQTLVDLQAGGELAETFAIGKSAAVEFKVKPSVIRDASDR